MPRCLTPCAPAPALPPLQMAQLKAVMAVVDPPLFKHLEKLGAQVSCAAWMHALLHAAACLLRVCRTAVQHLANLGVQMVEVWKLCRWLCAWRCMLLPACHECAAHLLCLRRAAAARMHIPYAQQHHAAGSPSPCFPLPSPPAGV